jgi:hypothetical protein
MANMLVPALGIGTPRGLVEIFASWSGTRRRGWGLSQEVDFWMAQKILQERMSDDQGNLWKRLHLQKACSKRRMKLKE